MSDFEYFFSFFGLLLGLTVAEVAVRFADAIDSHRRRSIGLLTPLLAIFVLLDISSFWLFTWSARDIIQINWPTMFMALVLALLYFLSAALVFPRTQEDWDDLDGHFWARKRYVLGGILSANIILHLLLFTRALPAITEYWFFVHKLIYFGPVTWAWATKKRGAAILALCLAIGSYALEYANVLPTSEWGIKLGLDGTVTTTASTSAPRVPR
ncbi:hypothetical protein G6N82_03030 [Altererythrobacter sp. BO-6]|uniref:hypothetical protein n=1 Tax=Altererythrobacter sp. BO-6 TaxID=2604537 RepID=UPI0013E18C6F|nr:hypothetical protein [Altererythrobacter sp. BO-6]QIG53260.1 hypothetical protein G6N82_03030 [Altererythrobacter sp. BO-6]